jgi:phage/plasmid primase-like uncharacterized protein
MAAAAKEAVMNTAYEFIKAIQAAGLTPPESMVPDGKLHRFASNGKRGDDAVWYVLHDDGIPAGCFGDWRTGVKENWRADGVAPCQVSQVGSGARVDPAPFQPAAPGRSRTARRYKPWHGRNSLKAMPIVPTPA